MMGNVDFQTWQAAVYAMGGVPTTWPGQAGQGHVGEPAARFDVDGYVAAYNNGDLPAGDGTWQSSGGTIYVLASAMTGGNTVVATSPHTMTAAERAMNAAFTAMGQAADKLGLPSLGNIEQGLMKTLAIGLAVLVGGALLLGAARGRRHG